MDTTPIVGRLSVIANAVKALRSLQNLTFEEFAGDHILYTSTERHLQVAIQAIIDIGSIILASESSRTPTTYKEIFPLLAETNVIPLDFAHQLEKMAGFRNILVHLYMEVDLHNVYHYLQHNLADFERFAQYIGTYLEQKNLGKE